MKKIVFLVIAVVLIAGAVVGGFAYAQSQGAHQPMVGQKLVGWGPVGLASSSNPFLFVTMLTLTNPDCVNQITIERVSVFAGNGTVIYEGPLLFGMVGEELTEPLAPHQTVDIFLPYYVLSYYFEELPADPLEWPGLDNYTIEVFWKANKGGLPLTGWAWVGTMPINAEGNADTVSSVGTYQMVNMTQVVTKGK
jgi:hypothetical protein